MQVGGGSSGEAPGTALLRASLFLANEEEVVSGERSGGGSAKQSAGSRLGDVV